MRALVDLDDEMTWPAGVAELAGPDVVHTDESYAEFRSALGVCDLLAFHATRLLDEEIASIRDEGMAVASDDLIFTKLSAATAAGHLTPEEAAVLAAGNRMSGPCGDAVRAGQLWFFMGRQEMREQFNGLSNLLGLWGGEIINFSAAAVPFKERLRRIGRPALVIAAVHHEPGFSIGTWRLVRAFGGRLHAAASSR